MKDLFVCLIEIACLALPVRAATAAWIKTEHSLALMNGTNDIWQIVADPSLGKPYFHPLATPGGWQIWRVVHAGRRSRDRRLRENTLHQHRAGDRNAGALRCGDALVSEINVPATEARHVRILCIQRGTQWGNAIRELMVLP